MSALNDQVGGDHYKNFKIQPIRFIVENDLGFIEGNIIKYITRYKLKGNMADAVKDLNKIKHYVDLLIEIKEFEESADWQGPINENIEKLKKGLRKHDCIKERY